MIFSNEFLSHKPEISRDDIRDSLYGSEALLIEEYIKTLRFSQKSRDDINFLAKTWIREVQNTPPSSFDIQSLLQAYPLSTNQGRALMTLAEALLRIPDDRIAKKLIEDKMQDADWSKLEASWAKSGLVDWATKGLKLADNLSSGKGILKYLKVIADPILLRAFRQMMRMIGQEFVLGTTIESALRRARKNPENLYSYDMLGEEARTWPVARAYKESYLHAIEQVASIAKHQAVTESDSVSVKLSALHPKYRFACFDEVMEKLVPDLLDLCIRAKELNVALTIDAEEVSRLDLSLEVIERVMLSGELKGWGGMGMAIQAYQKRAPKVIDWVAKLANACGQEISVRLVKGAYWDTEVKLAQTLGLHDYPVFTRKPATDVSYLYCAKKMLDAKGFIKPRFATHNAHTVSAILYMASAANYGKVEFQRLHGMGAELYEHVRKDHEMDVRVYAPVGDHHNLLPYLVRRLLENGANSSFVHKIHNKDLSLEQVVGDPIEFYENNKPGYHPKIPMPVDLYGAKRKNSAGDDLSDVLALDAIRKEIESQPKKLLEKIAGTDTDAQIKSAAKAFGAWDELGGDARAEIIKNAADIMESRRGLFYSLLINEGGKVLEDAQSELREAVDFCRYYANFAKEYFGEPTTLPGPTGELNQLSLRGRGVFACISPWNFPMAIFTGQVAAALLAGNSVIAKPAGQTPNIAKHVADVLYEAGVPRDVLHLTIGSGREIGHHLFKSPHLGGVAFTGSTDTAQNIMQQLVNRGGPIIPFIAETGGLNAMIVDSSALVDQVVDNVIMSAFKSAGQRCSALRMIFVQEDIYADFVNMLKDAMGILKVDDPAFLSTDLGPVIDDNAAQEIESYICEHQSQLLFRTPVSSSFKNLVAPALLEISQPSDVKREVFGPVLHIAPYKSKNFEGLIDAINDLGYGLTMGLQTRLKSQMDLVRSKIKAGNVYINRSMIGAVVGVQPFGGEGLSGTGPKAGGPHYLSRFGVERTWTDNIMARGGNVDLLNIGE